MKIPEQTSEGQALDKLDHSKIMQPTTYVGIDGGSSGKAVSTVDFLNWDVHDLGTVWLGGHRLLSVETNLEILNTVAFKAGGLQNVFVAYEQSRKNPRFGTKNNFVNGRNEEFWRVVLSISKVRFVSVDPKTWQSVCLKDITLSDTKERAREYLRRRCPSTDWLDAYNKAPREAIQDAMCIALWCRAQHLSSPATPASSAPRCPGDSLAPA
jgi:hypothetical protein